MAPVKRRQKEKEQRKSAILRSAQQLFFKRGFKAVTVESIAKQAKLSKGTVYLYFSSKEEIYAHILLNDIENFNRKVVDIVDKGGNASEMLSIFADIYVDFFLNDRELFRILMTFMLHTENLKFSPEMNRHMILATNRTIEIVNRILRHGLMAGEFSRKKDILKGQDIIWGLLNGIISLHLFTGKESTREARIRANVHEGLKIFIEGLKGPVFVPDESGR